MVNEGWIRLHRQFLSWEWFDKPEMVKLLIYLLLEASHEERKWRGMVIERGQVLTSLGKLAEELNLSVQSVRTCLTRLVSTGEITRKVTNKYSLVTLCNYDRYQSNEEGKVTSNQQATNRQTNKQTNQQELDLFGEVSTDYEDEASKTNKQTNKRTSRKSTNIYKNKEIYKKEEITSIEVKPTTPDWRFVSSVERYTLGNDPDRIAEQKKIYFRSEVESLAPIVGMAPAQVDKFVRYWTEHSKGSERIKADYESTFDMESRMRGWVERDAAKSSFTTDKPKGKMETLIDTHTELQQWIHDTYGSKTTRDRTPDNQSGE